MNAMQERAPRMTVLVHNCNVWMGASLRIARFDHESSRDDELMMNNLDTGEALWDGNDIRLRRSTDANDGEEAAGSILDGLLHVLADVTHLGRLDVRANGRSSIRRSVSHTNGRKFSSRNPEIKRTGNGYKVYISEVGVVMSPRK
jgi:hypothetical protein